MTEQAGTDPVYSTAAPTLADVQAAEIAAAAAIAATQAGREAGTPLSPGAEREMQVAQTAWEEYARAHPEAVTERDMEDMTAEHEAEAG